MRTSFLIGIALLASILPGQTIIHSFQHSVGARFVGGVAYAAARLGSRPSIGTAAVFGAAIALAYAAHSPSASRRWGRLELSGRRLLMCSSRSGMLGGRLHKNCEKPYDRPTRRYGNCHGR